MHIEIFTCNPFAENSYILFDNQKQAVIIDPGCYTNNERNEMIKFIEQNQLTITKILLTHCHIDHVMGLKFLKSKYQVPVLAHSFSSTTMKWVETSSNLYQIPVELPTNADEFIDEGDIIEVGAEKLEVLFTPGHSPDHVVFYNNENNFVINGDVLFRMSIGRHDLPMGNFETLKNSIQTKLYTLPDHTVVYCGHGEPTTIGFEKDSNPFVRG